MSDGFDQLMRLLSSRANDWLRDRLEELPAPLPPGHPLAAPLAEALGAARLLSGLMGRPAPAEILLRRHLDAAAVRRASLDMLAERRPPGAEALVVHDARPDPVRRLAIEQLAASPDTPLHLRLLLARDASTVAEAEAALLAPLPVRITPDLLTGRARLLVALWQGGASPPRLGSRHVAGQLHRRLQRQAEMARLLGNTEALAWTGVALGMLGGAEELRSLVPDIFPRQAVDGSFVAIAQPQLPAQPLAEGLAPTMAALAALHLAVLQRWRARPVPPEAGRPLHGCLALAAEAVAARMDGAADGWQRLRTAAALSRATGRDWFARLAPPRLVLDRRQAARLATVTFGDPLVAMRLRAACDLRHAAVADTAWLTGRAVNMRPMTAQAAARWHDAAERRDDAAFLAHCRLALRHPGTAPSPVAARAARRLAGAALDAALDPAAGLTEALDALERLVLLATVIEGEAPMRMAA